MALHLVGKLKLIHRTSYGKRVMRCVFISFYFLTCMMVIILPSSDYKPLASAEQ